MGPSSLRRKRGGLRRRRKARFRNRGARLRHGSGINWPSGSSISLSTRALDIHLWRRHRWRQSDDPGLAGRELVPGLVDRRGAEGRIRAYAPSQNQEYQRSGPELRPALDLVRQLAR